MCPDFEFPIADPKRKNSISNACQISTSEIDSYSVIHITYICLLSSAHIGWFLIFKLSSEHYTFIYLVT